MSDQRTANILGALALALTDAVRAGTNRAAPEGGVAPAAVTLVGLEPGLSINRLRRALGLSHPGAVRLVDRLVADGVVERRPAKRDGRAVALALTPEGKQVRCAILGERGAVLKGALGCLEPSERAALGALSEKLLAALVPDEAAAYATCRLCDGCVCTDCPVERGLASAG